MNNPNTSKNLNFPSIESEEIDLKLILNLVKRNKFLIFFFTFFSLLFSLIYTNIKTPIYEGSFQILVREESNNSNMAESSIQGILSGKSKSNKTQEFILQSSSVLNPVFEITKDKYLKRGDNVQLLKYSNWFKSKLKIEFLDKTDVLEISFKDRDEEFILDTLYLISSRYKDYARKEKKTNIKNGISFLEEQLIIQNKKFNDSQKKLNKFSIENGLGDLDGFVSIGDTNNLKVNSKLKNLSKNFFQQEVNQIPTKKGQRFQNQFALLEEYESKFIDLSSRLKPNAKVLKDLKIKIDNLRNSLKRPNEILIKFKELSNKAKREEFTLYSMEGQLSSLKIEYARKEDPWKLISKPTISDKKVSPNMKKNLFYAFLFSFIISSIIIYFKENKKGIIYDFNKLKFLIESEYLDTIYLNSIVENELIIDRIVSSDNAEKINISEIVFVSFAKNNLKNLNVKDLLKSKKYNVKILTFDDESLMNYNNVILYIASNNLDRNSLLIINQYLKIYRDNIKGWIYLDLEKNF